MYIKNIKIFIIILHILLNFYVYAVPTSFLLSDASTQNDVKWILIETEHFRVYIDIKAQNLGKYAANSLEHAFASYSEILKLKLASDKKNDKYLISSFDKIPVIIGTRVQTGGFANPATQGIELGVEYGSNATLFQHELAHRVMYEFFDWKIGPIGRGFSIAMIPTWWLEGFAEYLTESMGRVETAGVTRIMSLKDKWLSFDSLHALYNLSGSNTFKGYIISHEFFSYLMNKASDVTMPTLLNDYATYTIIPYFLNATSRVTNKYWQKDPEDLYEDLKKDRQKYWLQELSGMPWLEHASDEKRMTVWASSSVSDPRGIYYDKNHVIISNLREEILDSAFIIKNIKNKSDIRKPVSKLNVSSLFDIHQSQLNGGIFWTTAKEIFSNKEEGDNLIAVNFAKSFTEIANDNIKNITKINVSSANDVKQITQIQALSNNKAYYISNKYGENSLYLASNVNNTAVLMKKWPIPATVKILQRHVEDHCALILVDADFERSFIEKVCENGKSSIILPIYKAYIRDAVERVDGSLLLLVAYNSVLALAEWRNNNLLLLAPFPNWGGGIKITNDKENLISFWNYNGYNYDLYLNISINKLKTNYVSWVKMLPAINIWRNPITWSPYIPPYVKIAGEQKKLQLRVDNLFSNAKASSVSEQDVKKTAVQNNYQIPLVPVNMKVSEADYKFGHFFSYPYAYYDVFSEPSTGLSLGLVSIPFMDEMERQKVELSGQYNVTNKTYSLNIMYTNNRVLDGLGFSVFSRDKFNGYFYRNLTFISSNKYRVSYSKFALNDINSYSSAVTDMLNENGFELFVKYKLPYFPISVVPSLGLSFIDDGNIANSVALYKAGANDVIGAHKFTDMSFNLSVNINLINRGLLLSSESDVNTEYLFLNLSVYTNIENHKSLSSAMDYLGNEIGIVDYHKIVFGLSNNFSYNRHSLRLMLNYSFTNGKNCLNLQEYYVPYKTYLAGTNVSFNGLNFNLFSNGNLSMPIFGVASVSSVLNYVFPIYDMDKLISIVYLSDIKGELVIAYGGVVNDYSFGDKNIKLSGSISTKANFDIKGFQISPSVSYGRLLTNNEYTVYAGINFSDFF